MGERTDPARQPGPRSDGDAGYHVDKRTWQDLELSHVFDQVNHTLTPVGARCLYEAVSNPALSQEALVRRERLCEQVTSDQGVRLHSQLELQRLSGSANEGVRTLLWGELQSSPIPLLAMELMSWTLLIAVAATFVVSSAWIVAATMFVANISVEIWLQKSVLPRIAGLGALGRLLATAERLAKLHGLGLSRMYENLPGDLRECRGLRIRAQLLQVGDPFELIGYVRTVLLRNALAYFRAQRLIERHASALRRIYYVVGAVDVAQSIGSVRALHGSWCRPELSAVHTEFVARRLIHPQLRDGIPCDLQLSSNHSLIVTGSNMSGKSTLLRTVAVNAVLAQSINTVFASHYKAPYLCVSSAMNSKDEMVSGRSYYADEVDTVLRLVQEARSGPQHLFVVDEPFRGTNPAERVAAASEVLRYLASGNLVVAATHDLDVCSLTSDLFEVAHFAEREAPAGLAFDYVLRPGPSAGRNAVRLLELAGFPSEIVRGAHATVQLLDSRRRGLSRADPAVGAPE